MDELQKQLLASETFVLDGWHTKNILAAAVELLMQKLVTVEEIGSDDDQYTAWRFTITDEGRKLGRTLQR